MGVVAWVGAALGLHCSVLAVDEKAVAAAAVAAAFVVVPVVEIKIRTGSAKLSACLCVYCASTDPHPRVCVNIVPKAKSAMTKLVEKFDTLLEVKKRTKPIYVALFTLRASRFTLHSSLFTRHCAGRNSVYRHHRGPPCEFVHSGESNAYALL